MPPTHDPQPDEQQQSWMDALPDELLVAILGHLDDGETLLDTVPLVCKRWHRTSKDPQAWASVRISVERCSEGQECGYFYRPGEVCTWWPDAPGTGSVAYSMLFPGYNECDYRDFEYEAKWRACHTKTMQVGRVLLHAPFLRRLAVPVETQHCRHQERFLGSALRRSRAAVAELEVIGVPVEYIALLARSQGSLRALHVGLSKLTPELQLAVSQLAGLESMDLDLYSYSPFAYTGSLRDAFPRLRRLAVTFSYKELQPPCAALLADLVRCAAGSLRRLELANADPLPPAVAAEMQRCTELLSLTCEATDAGLLAALPSLRRLSLCLAYKAMERPSYAAAVSSATAALLASGPLPSLRELSVRFYSKPGEQLQGLEALMDALGSAASEVVSADLNFSPPFQLLGLLQRLRHLRSLRLPGCASPQALAVAAGLPELQRLDAELDPDEDEDEARITAAIDAFKRDRPDVQGDLHVWEEPEEEEEEEQEEEEEESEIISDEDYW